VKRFLVSDPLREGARIRLSPEESKHATRVMRLEVGAKVLLTDGHGKEAEAALVSAEKTGAVVEVKAVREAASRPFRLELLQGTLKGARMDWLVEKATELGVDAVRAVDTQFSVAGERHDRWARVAQAALKQSGNPRMPEFPEAVKLEEALARLPAGFCGFLLSPGAAQGLAAAVRAKMPSGGGCAVLAIGPEGGFSAEEEKLLEDKGFLPCRLSSQILRGETAGLVAASVALHALEFAPPAGV
jgi:16S rRNA (uracil1498-N3)-methyltransferase